MIVFNLTDVPPPGQPKRGPQTLRVFGKFLAPGEHAEFPDDSPMGKISGWVYTSKIGVDVLPSWYKAACRARSSAPRVVPDGPPKLVEAKGSVTVDVGVMEVKVDSGPDGELGTEDDTIEVKPKKKGKKKGKKK